MSARGDNRADGLARYVAARVEIFTVKAAVEAQGFASGGGCIEGKAAEFDPPGDEALDVEYVQAFVEPVHEERFGRGSMGADFPCIPLIDRGRLRQEGEDTEGDLSKRFGQCLAASRDAPGSADVDIAEGRGGGRTQEPPPMRSP